MCIDFCIVLLSEANGIPPFVSLNGLLILFCEHNNKFSRQSQDDDGGSQKLVGGVGAERENTSGN